MDNLVPTIKMKDIPQNITISIETENYEVNITTKYNEPKISVRFSSGLDNWATVELYNPNPEATINAIVRDVITLIEKYQSKKKTE